MGKPEIRLKYLKEQDKPYRNETNEKMNYTSDYVEWLEKQLSLCDVSNRLNEGTLEKINIMNYTEKQVEDILNRVWEDRIKGGGWKDKESFINTMKQVKNNK